MKPHNIEILNLLIIFIACILGVIISFLCITLAIDALVWLLTGNFELTREDIFKSIRSGCIIGSLTGSVFVTAKLLKLK